MADDKKPYSPFEEGGVDPLNPYGGDHPFEKVLNQMEGIIQMIDDNKNRELKEMPKWVEEEFDRLENKLEQFKEKVERTTAANKIDEKEFHKQMKALPKGKRPIESKVYLRAKALQERLIGLQKEFKVPEEQIAKAPEEINFNANDESPLELLSQDKSKKDKLSDEELRASLEHKKKFGRMGGKKNWRPL